MKDSCIILIIKAENFVFLSKMSLCYTFIKHDFTKYFVVHIVTSHRIISFMHHAWRTDASVHMRIIWPIPRTNCSNDLLFSVKSVHSHKSLLQNASFSANSLPWWTVFCHFFLLLFLSVKYTISATHRWLTDHLFGSYFVVYLSA